MDGTFCRNRRSVKRKKRKRKRRKCHKRRQGRGRIRAETEEEEEEVEDTKDQDAECIKLLKRVFFVCSYGRFYEGFGPDGEKAMEGILSKL